MIRTYPETPLNDPKIMVDSSAYQQFFQIPPAKKDEDCEQRCQDDVHNPGRALNSPENRNYRTRCFNGLPQWPENRIVLVIYHIQKGVGQITQ